MTLDVQIAEKAKKFPKKFIKDTIDFSVIGPVMLNLENNCREKNKMPIRACLKMANLNGFTLRDTEGHIPIESLTLKLVDMPANGMQKGNILLRNGKNCVGNSNGGVRSVESERNLLKITLNLFHSVEQIIFQTFSHFVVPVIVVNGKSFTRTPNY